MERVQSKEALRQGKYKTTGHTSEDHSLEFCSVSKHKGRDAANELIDKPIKSIYLRLVSNRFS